MSSDHNKEKAATTAIVAALVFLLLIVSTAPRVHASTSDNIILYATADTYDNYNAPDNNYGSSTLLGILSTYNRAFFKFPLSLPPYSVIDNVWLKVDVQAATANNLKISCLDTTYASGTGFNESTLTYNNNGTQAPFLTWMANNLTYNPEGWTTVQLNHDNFVNRINAGDSVLELRLEFDSGSGGVCQIYSKEAGVSYTPQLIVQYEPYSGGPTTMTMDSIRSGTRSGNLASVVLGLTLENTGGVTDYSVYWQITENTPTSPWIWSSSTTSYHFNAYDNGHIGITTPFVVTVDRDSWMRAVVRYVQINDTEPTEMQWFMYSSNDNRVYENRPFNPTAVITTQPASLIGDNYATLNYNIALNSDYRVDTDIQITTNADHSGYTTIPHRTMLKAPPYDDSGSYTYYLGPGNGYFTLNPSTAYYYQVVGYSYNPDSPYESHLIQGGWQEFTMGAPGTPGSSTTPPSVGIPGWKVTANRILNLADNSTGGGVFLSVLFCLPFLFIVLLFAQGSDNLFPILMVVGIMLLALCTFAFMWVEPWLLISLVIVMVFAGSLNVMRRG